MNSQQPCRFCHQPVSKTFANLGMTPLSNAYLTETALNKKEMYYPLHATFCEACFLVQLPEYESPENIFSEYAYFSSYSETWLQHAAQYATRMIETFSLTTHSKIMEIASNDGYLLQYFARQNIPVLGIEPAENVAAVAIEKGIPTRSLFLSQKTAHILREEYGVADLLIANNVLAHVPDLNDFVAGLKTLLAPQGILTLEFPHLLSLIENNQFDTIYHEHFSYFSLNTVQQLLSAHGLCLFDVEEFSVHGGSLRLFVKHHADHSKDSTSHIQTVLAKEKAAGLEKSATYHAFAEKIIQLKLQILGFFIEIKSLNKTIAGYGAPAKGNTLLNYCGIYSDLLPFTVDKNPYKQGRYLPGTRIPICSPDIIKEKKPDYLFILPWNLKNEIIEQMGFIKAWGGQFVFPIPNLHLS